MPIMIDGIEQSYNSVRARRALAFVVAAVVMIWSCLVHAERVTFEFAGVSTDSQPRLGKNIQGYYIFESTTLPNYGGGTINSYDGVTKEFQFVAGWYRGKLGTKEYGRWVHTEGNNRIRVTDRSEYRPLYSVRVPFLGNAPSIDGYGPPSFYLTVDQYIGSGAFQNQLPSAPPDLAKFKMRTISLQFVVKDQPNFVTNESYELTSLKRLPPGVRPKLPVSPVSAYQDATPYISKSSQPSGALQRSRSQINARIASGAVQCVQGLVWRSANATDYICVTPESRARVAQENAAAPSRRDPKGAYGPNSCVMGYVWREAFPGDVVCVTPEIRALVRQENQKAGRGN